jgi:hypothetical protein
MRGLKGLRKESLPAVGLDAQGAVAASEGCGKWPRMLPPFLCPLKRRPTMCFHAREFTKHSGPALRSLSTSSQLSPTEPHGNFSVAFDFARNGICGYPTLGQFECRRQIAAFLGSNRWILAFMKCL